MSQGVNGARAEGQGISVSVSTLAWATVTVAFLALRLGPIWHEPVWGLEAIHLSGAWQAHAGLGDGRFIPTLFQAITALVFRWTESEVPARVLAFAATASVPAALYCLRSRLGDAGALLALLILAVDGPSIAIGSSASALGFDLAIAAWLFVLIEREASARVPAWAWAALGFAVATGGPLPLPLVAGAAVVMSWRRQSPTLAAMAAFGAAALVGVLAASAGYGLPADGLVIAPFRLFAAGFDETWSSPTAFQVVAIYAWPTLAAGAAASGWRLAALRKGTVIDPTTIFLLAWAGFAALWLVASGNSHNPVPVAALSLPLALLLGPAIAAAGTAMVNADWQYARYFVPAALVAGALAMAVVVDWARADHVGDGADRLRVALLLALAGIATLAGCVDRPGRPALWAVAGVVGSFALAPGAFGIGLSGAREPLLSPASPGQARILRDVALELRAPNGGEIAIHDQFRDSPTWPFRDSGDLLLVSRAPADAAVVIWPAALAPPDGFTRLEGEWSLSSRVRPPTGDLLDYLHWLVDRNRLPVSSDRAIVYTRERE